MASVVTAQSSRHPFVYEPSHEWRALLSTFGAVFAVLATIFLFALL
jgi:hypothetical protein